MNGRCRDEVGKQLVRRVSLRGVPNESPLTALCTPPLARPLHCATAVCSHRIAAPLTAPRTVTAAIPLSHTSFLIPSLLPPCRPPPPCLSLLLDLFLAPAVATQIDAESDARATARLTRVSAADIRRARSARQADAGAFRRRERLEWPVPEDYV